MKRYHGRVIVFDSQEEEDEFVKYLNNSEAFVLAADNETEGVIAFNINGLDAGIVVAQGMADWYPPKASRDFYGDDGYSLGMVIKHCEITMINNYISDNFPLVQSTDYHLFLKYE